MHLYSVKDFKASILISFFLPENTIVKTAKFWMIKLNVLNITKF